VGEPTALEKSINRRCRGCHEKAVLAFSRRNVHLPVKQGNCSACHLDHGSEPRLLLLEREDRLCGKCHELRSDSMGSAHRGYRLAKARCTECHDPHSSGRDRLFYDREHEPFAERDCRACHKEARKGWALGESINAVCGECHDDIAAAPVLHSALPSRGCTGCHRPHGGEESSMLRASVPALCLSCHDASSFAGETVHAPVEEGDCGACHPPHGSERVGLFVEPYPMERYVNFGIDLYGLCWECHDGESLSDPETGTTNFRNGQENLHALHIRDHLTVTGIGDRVSPGLTCRNCHNPHATEGARLIRKALDCDGVPCLQLEYHKVGEGGKCMGGCHTMKSYDP
jgi:predicted CXXCH cytochrome family protein